MRLIFAWIAMIAMSAAAMAQGTVPTGETDAATGPSVPAGATTDSVTVVDVGTRPGASKAHRPLIGSRRKAGVDRDGDIQGATRRSGSGAGKQPWLIGTYGDNRAGQ